MRFEGFVCPGMAQPITFNRWGTMPKFADIRPVLLKYIDSAPLPEPEKPETMATPKWLSPYPSHSGYVIAMLREVVEQIPVPAPKLRKRKVRKRVRGVSLRGVPFDA